MKRGRAMQGEHAARLVVDASVAIKWVVAEEGSPEAVALLSGPRLCAPDLLIPECANILWKKAARSELTGPEAVMAARVLQHAEIELHPMRALLEPATQLAIDLDHPAYDCTYLALAAMNGWRFVTADRRLIDKARRSAGIAREAILSLQEAAASIG